MELTSVPEQAACADEPRTPRQRRSPLRQLVSQQGSADDLEQSVEFVPTAYFFAH